MRIIDDIVSQGHGWIDPRYLFVHSTGNPGATAKNHHDAGRDGNWQYITQYVCDWTNVIYHLMPDDRKAYAVGNGNAYGVNLEICEGTNQTQFDGSWTTAVEFCAYYLNKRGWSIDRLMSHNEARLKWGGTNHTDPGPYFKKWGRTWEQFKQAVETAMIGDDLMEVSIPKGTYPVYRAYNPTTSAHFYTSSEKEYKALDAAWTREGIAWNGADTGQVIYRLRNPYTGQYHYTISYSEATKLARDGWKVEGCNMASARDGKPVYRLYNPNNGDHFFTTSEAERDNCLSHGWNDEKIAFYVI